LWSIVHCSGGDERERGGCFGGWQSQGWKVCGGRAGWQALYSREMLVIEGPGVGWGEGRPEGRRQNRRGGRGKWNACAPLVTHSRTCVVLIAGHTPDSTCAGISAAHVQSHGV